MSLINQMLKDLESRRNPELPAGGVLTGSDPTPATRGARPVILLLVLLVVLLALGLGYTLQQQKAAPAALTTTVTASQAQAAAPAANPPAPTTPKVEKAHPTTTVITPRQPELLAQAKVQTAIAKTVPALLSRISPSVIDGSWQARRFTLRGEHLNAQHKVIVRWSGKEKVLPQERVEWVDPTTAHIKLVTGNNDEIWQIALLRPDGSRSNSVEFEVIASPYIGNPDQAATAGPQIKKTIRPPSSSERADQLYQQGYRTLQQRKADRAEELWQQALKVEAAHTKSREGLIALYLSQGRQVEASKLLEEGVKQQPDNARFALLHARLLAEQGEITNAISTLKQAMKRAVQKPELFALAAALYQQQGNYSQSISSYQRALQLQPQQAAWWMGLGISLEGEGKGTEAKVAYEEALQRGGLNGTSLNYVRQRLHALQ